MGVSEIGANQLNIPVGTYVAMINTDTNPADVYGGSWEYKYNSWGDKFTCSTVSTPNSSPSWTTLTNDFIETNNQTVEVLVSFKASSNHFMSYFDIITSDSYNNTNDVSSIAAYRIWKPIWYSNFGFLQIISKNEGDGMKTPYTIFLGEKPTISIIATNSGANGASLLLTFIGAANGRVYTIKHDNSLTFEYRAINTGFTQIGLQTLNTKPYSNGINYWVKVGSWLLLSWYLVFTIVY